MNAAEQNQGAPTLPSNSTNMEISRLLLLPKELRLAIWTYVLTDSSINTIRISRQDNGPSTSGLRYSNSLRRDSCTEVPQVTTSFEKPRNLSTNVQLLMTNRLIYDEGIPILYRSVKFHPCDLEGIFPLFLESISPFAQSHIRYVKLSMPSAFRCPSSYFYWALTCAQVAKLSESLRQVEIEGDWPRPETDRRKGNLLNPLLKIKAPKKFCGPHDDEFQKLLKEAQEELHEKAPMRKALTETSTADWTARETLERAKREKEIKIQKFRELTSFEDYTLPPASPPPVDEEKIAKDLSAIAGIEKFQKDLEQWEMVNAESEPMPHRPRKRTASALDDDTWTDAASTIIAKDEDDDDAKDQDWEFVESPLAAENGDQVVRAFRHK